MYIRNALRWHRQASLLVLSLVWLLVMPLTTKAEDIEAYQQLNLVSDLPGMAPITDTKLRNPWGLAHSPTSPWWVADNGTGVSTLYNGAGKPFPLAKPLVVTIPGPAGSSNAAPTGTVFNGTAAFAVNKAGKSAPSLFLFATEDGTIAGWNPQLDATQAILAPIADSTGAVYKGLAIASTRQGNFLYAANFHAGKVDVFDSHFQPIRHAGAFTDPTIPADFGPFGIQNLNGKIYVTYAKQKLPDKHDDQAGPGNGFVDVFNTEGKLLKRLISHGPLNSPWGLALSPGDFGRFSHKLLVGNFGDGKINVFEPRSGRFLGQLRDQQGVPFKIDGLWGLAFGNDGMAGRHNELFFTAGINEEAHGLFGKIKPGEDD